MIQRHRKLFLIITEIVAFSLIFESCSSIPLLTQEGNKYKYEYLMTSPITDPNLVYRDSTIYVQFRFDDSALRFQFQNLSSNRLELDWSKISLGVKGKFYSIRNSKTLYSASASTQVSTVLPPLGYFTDFVIPEKNISTDGSYKEIDLLPTSDKNSSEVRQKIMDNVGTEISLMFPLRVGAASKEYTFRFNVAAINQVSWDKLKTPIRPPKPIKTQEIYNTDQYIAAGIIIAVVGVASIMLTQKKTPPSE
ncbi:MAG: hypothetical protein ACHQQQ_09985 [Bacteroidota bacterium]